MNKPTTKKQSLIPVVTLITINALLPLLGYLLLDWSAVHMIFAYWTETFVVSVFALFKVRALPDNQAKITVKDNKGSHVKTGPQAKKEVINFFAIIFGAFGSVHLIGLIVLFQIGGFDVIGNAGEYLSAMLLGFIALLGSHGASYYINFLVRGERQETEIGSIVLKPLMRIFPMHIVVIIGAVVITAFDGDGGISLAILVVAKILFDIFSHRFEHSVKRTKSTPSLRSK